MSNAHPKPVAPAKFVDRFTDVRTAPIGEVLKRAEAAVADVEVLLNIAFARSRGLRRGDMNHALNELYSVRTYLAPTPRRKAVKQGVQS